MKRVKLDFSKEPPEIENFRRGMARLVAGQQQAVDVVADQLAVWCSGFCEVNKPVGSFMFLGPTGTGKTKVAESVAEVMVQNPKALIKLDCGEFQHSHEVAKIIGSPPGYLGHRETQPVLSQERLNQHHTETVKLSFVLFDEIEKASDALWNMLLGILDKATLTLGDNRRVDFSNALIFMTSNVGASAIQGLSSRRFDIGSKILASLNSQDPNATNAKIQETALNSFRKKFTPEFINRLDHIVVFKPLDDDLLRKILNMELSLFQDSVFKEKADAPFVITYSDKARNFLLNQDKNLAYGARPLKRTINRHIRQPISKGWCVGIESGHHISVDWSGDNSVGLEFFIEGENLSLSTMISILESNGLKPSVLPNDPQRVADGKKRAARR